MAGDYTYPVNVSELVFGLACQRFGTNGRLGEVFMRATIFDYDIYSTALVQVTVEASIPFGIKGRLVLYELVITFATQIHVVVFEMPVFAQ